MHYEKINCIVFPFFVQSADVYAGVGGTSASARSAVRHTCLPRDRPLLTPPARIVVVEVWNERHVDFIFITAAHVLPWTIDVTLGFCYICR